MNVTQKKNAVFEANIASETKSFISQSNFKDVLNSSTAVALPKQDFSGGDIVELDETIKLTMERGENMIRHGAKKMDTAYIRKVCGKEGHKHVIKDHIEANHLDGISIPCNLCEKTFRSRNALRMHITRNHALCNK